MWSKIKNLIKIPISIKLTVLYTTILFCILLLTSFLTVGGLCYSFYAQTKNDIEISSRNITDYLAAGNRPNHNLLEENILVSGVMLRVFDDKGSLLLDTAPQSPENRKLFKKHQKYDEDDEDEFEFENFFKMILLHKAPFRIIHIKDTYFYYVTQLEHQGYNSYQIHLFQTITEQVKFIKNLTNILLTTNIIGLLISIVSGIFISRKILQPIRDITTTAKQIEIHDLGKRIELSGSNDELSELAKTFNNMLNKIETGLKQQQRFVSDASHELRTPITVISGYANMIDRWGKEDSTALDEGIQAIKSETAHMHGLIEKLLFLARIDQNKQVINKKRLNIQPLIDEIVQETSLIAPEHNIILEQNDSAEVCADYSFIKQMLRIFIENSIKYTPAGGSISISSRLIKNSHNHGEFIEINIKDSGIGIPKEEQSQIFDRFYRVDKSRSKSTGGTGLGLSIANWIAQEHTSSIELTSQPGEGTMVTVKIPLI